ncbi:hypothetical protein [Mycoplasma phocimorsus]|uniref:hypothetical protein n=1 Tax=Mycoplasma phocimorsus TaxID=3045839 RepID=UPI0024BF64C6|nr:hypothetical protein [Mycoplasma phocimorsus]MDJ1647265.1 hypothetical protein [Mycoplasma phocimorsus]
MATKLILYCHKHDKNFTLISGITLRSFYLHKYLQLLMNKDIKLLEEKWNLSQEESKFLAAWKAELNSEEKNLIKNAIKENKKITKANFFFNPFSNGKEIVNMGMLEFEYDGFSYKRKYNNLKNITFIQKENGILIKCPIDENEFLDVLQQEEVI